MGNLGLRKLYFPGDYVETKHKNFYEIDAVDLNLQEQSMKQHENKVILCTNIASQNQESQKELQKLQQIYQTQQNYFQEQQQIQQEQQQKDQKKQKKNKKEQQEKLPEFNNLALVCFPTNSFNNEPGTFTELKQAYLKNQDSSEVKEEYKNLQIFGKVEVNGQYMHPVYRYLKRNSILFDFTSLFAAPLVEDFSKFLVNQNGEVVKYYRRDVSAEQINEDIRGILYTNKQVSA